MIGTLRKHQTWLWAVIITATIISFVYFFSPMQKMNNTRGPVNYGSINGEPITPEDFANARNETELRYFFRSGGNWPNEEAKRNGFDQEREIYQWLLLAQKERQMGINISSEMAAQAARGMLSQFQKMELTPQIFLQKILEPHGLQAEDFERFIRHELGIQELIATVGLSGKLVTPQDIKAIYVRQHEELNTEAAFFSASNYLSTVTVTPEAVAQYYANDTNKYRIPDRVQVSYVKFELSNFVAEATQELAKMTNMDQEIDTAYRQNGTNLLRELKVQSLEEAKVKVRENRLKAFEAQSARKKAAEFANVLFNAATLQTENLETLARTNGMKTFVSAPFDAEEGPKDLEVGEDFTKAAFSLTPTDPFAPPLIGKDAVYVIAFNKQIPSEIPPLDQIRVQVTADYKFHQALMRARQEGAALSQKLTLGMAQGKTFAAICEEAKVKPVVLAPFSLSARRLIEAEEHLSLDQLKQLAFSTAPGKVSNFQATSEGGVILYVKSKLPPDDTKMNSDLPAFANNLRLNRQQEAFNVWFSREAERAMRDTPLMQRKQQPSAMPRQRKS
jgi:hypothetical protein